MKSLCNVACRACASFFCQLTYAPCFAAAANGGDGGLHQWALVHVQGCRRKGVDDSSIMGRRILTVEISDIIFAMRLQRDKTNATALPADSVYQSTNHNRVSRPSQSGSVGSVSSCSHEPWHQNQRSSKGWTWTPQQDDCNEEGWQGGCPRNTYSRVVAAKLIC